MNAFFNSFVSTVTNPDVVSVYTKYVTSKSRYSSFCFVEGYTDVQFYMAVLPSKINKSEGSIGYIPCGGKTTVKGILNYFKAKNLPYDKYYYIVDKDYNYDNSEYTQFEKNKISTTKYHSMENYFFEKDNLELVLDNEGYNEEEKETFYKYLDAFNECMLKFESITYLKSLGYVDNKLKSDLLSKEIFDSKYKLTDEFNKFLEGREQRIGDDYKEKYLSHIERLKKNYLLMRGHDLEFVFNDINSSLKKNDRLTQLLANKKLIKQFNVEIKIK